MEHPEGVELSIQKRIAVARHEAKVLYGDVELVRSRIQDTTLYKAAKDIKKIPRNSCNLRLYNTLQGHQNKIAKIRWSSDSSKLLSASQDGYMIVWDAVSGFKKQAITLENQWVLTCNYSHSNRLIASAGLDNACTIYKIRPVMSYSEAADADSFQMQGSNFYQSIQSVFKGHTAYISDTTFINDNLVVTASGDSTCSMWDVSKGKKSRDFIDHLGDVLCLAKFPNTSPDGPLFISGSSDGYAKVWDIRENSPVQSFLVSNTDVNCLSIFPDGNAFISGSDDGMLRMFDLRSDCELSSYSLTSQLKDIDTSKLYNQLPAYSKFEGSRLSGSSDRSLSVFSSIEVPGVLSADFSKSGRLIYACYSDFGCIIWDTLKCEIVGSIGNDHTNKINQVSVSPDGLGVATASWDATIKVWSV